MAEITQALRDKFRAVATQRLYPKANSALQDALYAWDRTAQVYKNGTVQQFFLVFLDGVDYGIKTETANKD